MQKRVCLLFPRFDEGFVMRKVPLGLAYLAASLKEHGVAVAAYNLNCDDFEAIDFSDVDMVGITCLTPFVDEIRRLCRLIKARNGEVKIVVGGAHPTFNRRSVFEALPLVDYAVSGEGEDALPRLVMAAETGDAGNGAESAIPGVYFRDGRGRVRGAPPEPVDIHALPHPDLAVFDHGNLEARNPLRAITASRGCPYRCRNCQPILNQVQPVRLRTPEAVVAEMVRRQARHGVTHFGFIDSEFPLKKKWLLEFHALVQKEKLAFTFHCNARSDLLDEDILKIFKALNITRLAVGVESGVQRVVDAVLLKHIDLEATCEIFRLGQEEIGIPMHAHFMLGMPGETPADWEATLAYAEALPAASLEFNMLTPWPGTAFWDLCVDKDYLVETDSARFNEKRKSYVSTPEFSNSDVEAFYEVIRQRLTGLGYRNSADGSVYFHPAYAREGAVRS